MATQIKQRIVARIGRGLHVHIKYTKYDSLYSLGAVVYIMFYILPLYLLLQATFLLEDISQILADIKSRIISKVVRRWNRHT